MHEKCNFTDGIRMEKLLSVMVREIKRTVIWIGKNGVFYATAVKTWKSNMGQPVVVLFL